MNNLKKLLFVSLASILLVSCSGGEETTTTEPAPKDTGAYLINGGFESADLSGWTVEYGDGRCSSSCTKCDIKTNILSICNVT